MIALTLVTTATATISLIGAIATTIKSFWLVREPRENKSKESSHTEYNFKPRFQLWLCQFSQALYVMFMAFGMYFLNSYLNVVLAVFITISMCLTLFIRPVNQMHSLTFIFSLVCCYTISVSTQLLWQDANESSYDTDFFKTIFVITSLFASISTLAFHIADISTPLIPQRKPPPTEFTCSFFKYMSFSFLNEIIANSQIKPSLETEDLPTLFDSDSCEHIYNQLNFQDDPDYIAMHFTRKVFSVVSEDFYAQGLFQLFTSCINYIPPICLKCILSYIATMGTQSNNEQQQTDLEKSQSFSIVSLMNVQTAIVLLFLGPFLMCIMNGQNYTRARRNYGKTKAAFISCLYKKALYVDMACVKDGTGTLSNLISFDVSEISEFVAYFHFLWSAALEAGICLFLLYMVLGVSAVSGLAVMCLTLPLGGVGSKFLETYQQDQLKIKDERLAVITEILSGIRIIKVSLASHCLYNLSYLFDIVS